MERGEVVPEVLGVLLADAIEGDGGASEDLHFWNAPQSYFNPTPAVPPPASSRTIRRRSQQPRYCSSQDVQSRLVFQEIVAASPFVIRGQTCARDFRAAEAVQVGDVGIAVKRDCADVVDGDARLGMVREEFRHLELLMVDIGDGGRRGGDGPVSALDQGRGQEQERGGGPGPVRQPERDPSPPLPPSNRPRPLCISLTTQGSTRL